MYLTIIEPPDTKRLCSSFPVWNLINTASVTHLGTQIERTSSPVFIVFQLGTGWPEGLIDWLLLGFIQSSNSVPDPLIQPVVGSDPHPLKLSTAVYQILEWMKYVYTLRLSCLRSVCECRSVEILFGTLSMLCCRVISTCPTPDAAGLWMGFMWCPNPAKDFTAMRKLVISLLLNV